MEKFLFCVSLDVGAMIIAWWHLINAVGWTSYLIYVLHSFIITQLAVMMIFAISLFVFAFYIKLCIDLMEGVKKCDFRRVNNFKTLLLIFIAIIFLQLAWIVLTNSKAFPISKVYLIAFMSISLVIEIYCFLILDSFAQKLQDILSTRTDTV